MFKGVFATCQWILYRFKHFNSTFHQTEREFTCVEFMLIQNLLSLHRIFGACKAVVLPTIFSRARRVDLFYVFRGKSKRDRLSQSPSRLISDPVPVVGLSPGRALGSLGRYVPPGTPNWHPALKKFPLKLIPVLGNGPIFYTPFQNSPLKRYPVLEMGQYFILRSRKFVN